ncbi:polysaccharide pyruvyl transferase family protein [Blastococcus sp. URHD0036]|uniref:polysaccharide pyruvyl transferase family protein n=1 Tax=Blastococcus sp. URHD0036 TaxID=1380356 RepID=UPI0009DECEE2|nr:polysaccharide pyruvyl transferase family protein [Blastococcus sp. URHD0036]
MTEPRGVSAPISATAQEPPPDDAPRILIDSSEYWLQNMGDLAMLEVTIRRLRARWPRGRIGVLTETPALLRAYFPGVDPIEPWARSAWRSAGPLARLAGALGPRAVGPYAIGRVEAAGWLRRTAGQARATADQLVRALRRRRHDRGHGLGPEEAPPTAPSRDLPPNTRAAAAASSLVVALGGGYLADADPRQSARVLSLLEYARRHGVPTAMLGQGLGPIEEPWLVSRAAEVLPSVDVIALREGRRGPALLDRAGVPSCRVVVTGDDAIELAYSQRPRELGQGLGICLRIAGYSPVSDAARRSVGRALRTAVRELATQVVPVIISEIRSEDRRSTLPLVEGLERGSRPPHRFARPQEVAAQVGRCRVMVTGAYHAAVFALSQGISVVALTSSVYYDDKFLGLADMFGTGLHLVRIDGDDLTERLSTAIGSAWAQAPQARPALLAGAAEQIARSRTTFQRVCDLV